MLLAMIAQATDRSEGWLWWLGTVTGLIILLLILGVARRRLLRPMPHTPSDTSDAWAEAGRRLPVPPPEEGKKDSGHEESP
jgi:hypothetical protein